MMCGMKLLNHKLRLQLFTVEWIINSSHTLLGMWLLIHIGIKVIHIGKGGLSNLSYIGLLAQLRTLLMTNYKAITLEQTEYGDL